MIAQHGELASCGSRARTTRRRYCLYVAERALLHHVDPAARVETVVANMPFHTGASPEMLIKFANGVMVSFFTDTNWILSCVAAQSGVIGTEERIKRRHLENAIASGRYICRESNDPTLPPMSANTEAAFYAPRDSSEIITSVTLNRQAFFRLTWDDHFVVCNDSFLVQDYGTVRIWEMMEAQRRLTFMLNELSHDLS